MSCQWCVYYLPLVDTIWPRTRCWVGTVCPGHPVPGGRCPLLPEPLPTASVLPPGSGSPCRGSHPRAHGSWLKREEQQCNVRERHFNYCTTTTTAWICGHCYLILFNDILEDGSFLYVCVFLDLNPFFSLLLLLSQLARVTWFTIMHLLLKCGYFLTLTIKLL